uniref:Protein-L-isoaspartate O-methyltransferase n=1 Tax=Arcella intermedia TaxID=1963864 RepID=A0A6B2LI86_9EUKA
MKSVDRGKYIREHFSEQAYFDCPLSIGQSQTISAPHMHTIALEELQPVLKEGSRVLDVGAGSGYLTACLGLMVGDTGKVYGLEILPELVQFAQQNIQKGNPSLLEKGIVSLILGNGWEGYPGGSPYDAIHVGAAAESIPAALMEQLANGGRMIIPVGRKGQTQQLLKIDKDPSGATKTTQLLDVVYVPLVKRL